MEIEHIAMYVDDLEGAKAFFVKYFRAEPNELYHNPNTDFRSCFLTFDSGARLEIMNRPGLAADTEACRRGFVHIAFRLGSAGRVDALTERLRADVYKVLSGPRTTGDGYYESCIAGIEGCQIELTI